MNCEEALLQEIFDEGISLVRLDGLPIRAFYVRAAERALIAVSTGIPEPDRVCVYAEELGHHHTSTGNLLRVCAREYERQERRARKWAYNRLVPLDEIGKAYFEQDADPDDMAEGLSVPRKYLDDAIRHYTDVFGVECHTDTYHFQFIPYLLIEKLN